MKAVDTELDVDVDACFEEVSEEPSTVAFVVIVLSRIVYSGIATTGVTYVVGVYLFDWELSVYGSLQQHLFWIALFGGVAAVVIWGGFKLWMVLSYGTAYVLSPSFRQVVSEFNTRLEEAERTTNEDNDTSPDRVEEKVEGGDLMYCPECSDRVVETCSRGERSLKCSECGASPLYEDTEEYIQVTHETARWNKEHGYGPWYSEEKPPADSRNEEQ